LSGTALFLLDTNMASYILSGRSPAARQKMQEVQVYAVVAVSALTQGEILFGLEKKPEALRLRAAVETFLSAVRILPWDTSVAPAYGKLRAGLGTAGKSLSGLDMLIAGHALALGATLVSHDGAFQHASHFLQVVDWATDL